MEDFQSHLALDELEVLIELVGLVDVLLLDSSSLGLLREVLLIARAFDHCGR